MCMHVVILKCKFIIAVPVLLSIILFDAALFEVNSHLHLFENYHLIENLKAYILFTITKIFFYQFVCEFSMACERKIKE